MAHLRKARDRKAFTLFSLPERLRALARDADDRLGEQLAKLRGPPAAARRAHRPSPHCLHSYGDAARKLANLTEPSRARIPLRTPPPPTKDHAWLGGRRRGGGTRQACAVSVPGPCAQGVAPPEPRGTARDPRNPNHSDGQVTAIKRGFRTPSELLRDTDPHVVLVFT